MGWLKLLTENTCNEYVCKVETVMIAELEGKSVISMVCLYIHIQTKR